MRCNSNITAYPLGLNPELYRGQVMIEIKSVQVSLPGFGGNKSFFWWEQEELGKIAQIAHVPRGGWILHSPSWSEGAEKSMARSAVPIAG